jgi:sodium-coupled neutral amino acid transporter 11
LGDLWKQVNAQSGSKTSSSSSQVVSLASLIFCFGCTLMFSLMVGASLSSLLGGAPFASLLPPWALTRQASILAVTATTILPLCNLSSPAALAPVSVIGVVGTMIITSFMAVNCPSLMPNSPYGIPGSGLLSNVPSNLQPSFCTYNRFFSPAPLVLIAMASVALMAHFSAPEFYHSLLASTSSQKKINPVNQQLDDNVLSSFNKMTALSYVTVAIINGLIMAFGFLTFGGNCDGMILNNYSNADRGANLSRLLIIVSIIGTYPFLLGAGRSAALELFYAGQEATKKRELRMTGILLAITTAISLVVKDVGFVVSFNGALMGSIIIYIFPALLFLKQTAFRIANGEKIPRFLHLERFFCRLLVGFGGISAAIGGATSVIVSFFPHLLQ